MLKLNFTCLLFLVIVTFGLAQQRPVFSQYMFNGLAINPAYAGNQKQLSVSGLYRKQWVNLDGAPSVQTLTVHSALKKRKMGLGLMISNDAIGVHNDIGLYTFYSYQIKTEAGTLSLGLQAGFNNLKSDFTKLNARDAGDGMFPDVAHNFSPNFGTGAYFVNSKYYLGISVPYLINNTLSKAHTTKEFSVVPREARYYFLSGGVIFDMSPTIRVKPSALIRLQEGAPLGFDLNGSVYFYELVSLGTSYRSGDSWVFLFELITNENFKFGYAYDWVLSGLSKYTQGTHELMFNYRIDISREKCFTYF